MPSAASSQDRPECYFGRTFPCRNTTGGALEDLVLDFKLTGPAGELGQVFPFGTGQLTTYEDILPTAGATSDQRCPNYRSRSMRTATARTAHPGLVSHLFSLASRTLQHPCIGDACLQKLLPGPRQLGDEHVYSLLIKHS
jgi:hypothetical protein